MIFKTFITQDIEIETIGMYATFSFFNNKYTYFPGYLCSLQMSILVFLLEKIIKFR
mgnify:CR=1 FL=1